MVDEGSARAFKQMALGQIRTDPSRDTHHDYLWPAVRKLLPPKGRVLDIGCGTGQIAKWICELGHEVIAVDVEENNVVAASARFPMIKFRVRSAYDELAEPDGRLYDAIVAVEVIEHLYDPLRFFQRAHSALATGGKLIVTTPYHGYLKNLALSLANAWDRHHMALHAGDHIKFFSKRSLSAGLRQTGFRTGRIIGAGRIPYLWKSIVAEAWK